MNVVKGGRGVFWCTCDYRWIIPVLLDTWQRVCKVITQRKKNKQSGAHSETKMAELGHRMQTAAGYTLPQHTEPTLGKPGRGGQGISRNMCCSPVCRVQRCFNSQQHMYLLINNPFLIRNLITNNYLGLPQGSFSMHWREWRLLTS
jgi:hypothetical protein